jgi:heme/copper-type cytochrome/quinol oxidase subunit 2
LIPIVDSRPKAKGATVFMKKIPGAVILVILLMAIRALPGTLAPDSPRVIEVIADKDNTFKVAGEKKPVITVKPGEKIVVKITSHFGGEQAHDGSVHSFVVKKLREQGWDIRLKEGTQECPLVAPQQTGEYLIECTVKCGRGHDDMKMKLIVKN